MTSDDSALRAALGPYAQQVLVVISDDGRIRRPHGQPPLMGFVDDGDITGRNVAEFCHPDDLALVLVRLEEIRRGDIGESTTRVRGRHADGSWIMLDATMIDAREDPAIDGIVLRLVRTSAADSATDADAEAERPAMHSLAEALSAGVLAANRKGEVVYVNRAAAELFGRDTADLLDLGWQAAIHPADAGELAATAAAAVGNAGWGDVVFRMIRPSGETRWVHGRASSIGDANASAGWVVVLNDITRQRATEADLAHTATHDPLTGLPNRLLLQDRLQQAIARVRRADEHVGVMFLDLDDFKKVNDSFGHAVGDATLVDFAARVQQAIRPGDTAARVGGDEFVIIAADVDEARALAIAERVAAAVRIKVDGNEAPVTIGASIGIALAGPGVDAETVLGLADQAMYQAKRRPGGGIVVADAIARA